MSERVEGELQEHRLLNTKPEQVPVVILEQTREDDHEDAYYLLNRVENRFEMNTTPPTITEYNPIPLSHQENEKAIENNDIVLNSPTPEIKFPESNVVIEHGQDDVPVSFSSKQEYIASRQIEKSREHLKCQEVSLEQIEYEHEEQIFETNGYQDQYQCQNVETNALASRKSSAFEEYLDDKLAEQTEEGVNNPFSVVDNDSVHEESDIQSANDINEKPDIQLGNNLHDEPGSNATLTQQQSFDKLNDISSSDNEELIQINDGIHHRSSSISSMGTHEERIRGISESLYDTQNILMDQMIEEDILPSDDDTRYNNYDDGLTSGDETDAESTRNVYHEPIINIQEEEKDVPLDEKTKEEKVDATSSER